MNRAKKAPPKKKAAKKPAKKSGGAPRGEGSRVQSLIFDKQYWTPQRAQAKAKEMGFAAPKADVKANTLRFRQNSPDQYQTFRTVTMPKHPSIKMVIGIKHPR